MPSFGLIQWKEKVAWLLKFGDDFFMSFAIKSFYGNSALEDQL